MKKFLHISGLMMICLTLMAGSASAMDQYYGYYNPSNTGGGSSTLAVSVCPKYPTGGNVPGGGYPGGGYPGGGYNNGGYGCGQMVPSWCQRPVEYCSKWIPGHWVQVRVMMPGRWVYRPVWVPSYPVSKHKWVPGFWQTTVKNGQPDLQIWGSPNSGWYGKPYQSQAAGGYFTPQGVWIPAKK